MPLASDARYRASSAEPEGRKPPEVQRLVAGLPSHGLSRAERAGRGSSPDVLASKEDRRVRDASSPPPRGKSVALNEAAVRRIWQKLDRFNTGAIQVKDIVANAAFLSQECPKLLEEYHTLASGGSVKYQNFRRLLLGPNDGTPLKKEQITNKVSEDDLRRLFEALKDKNGFITAKSLADHKEEVMKQFPPLIQEFEKIDLDGNSKISWDELKVYIGGTAEWLELELESIVGLDDLKDQVRAFYRSIMLDRTRRQHGHDVSGIAKAPHMIFQGNPGTGKTSLGRIMASLLHRIGIISTAGLKEVQRPDLVGEHVGQTAPKTQEVITGAKDGVLFVDEAYRLTSVESKNDFGREAVETLMAAMNEPPGKSPVIILAGYTKDMTHFMRANEGLYRRIGYTFNFSDYNPLDLAHIFELRTHARGFKIEQSLLDDNRKELAKLIEDNTLPHSRSLMNGGLCERMFDTAKQNLDARDDPSKPSVVLSFDDIRAACLAIPAPPSLEAPQSVAPISQGIVSPAPQVLAPMASQSCNIWFHVDRAEGLRQSCLSTPSCWVSVRLDKKEVHCTAATTLQASGSGTRLWQDTRIVPYNRELALEFVVQQKGKFLGSAVVILSSCDVFDGELELLSKDKPVGKLFVKVGWQHIAAEKGGKLLKECFAHASI